MRKVSHPSFHHLLFGTSESTQTHQDKLVNNRTTASKQKQYLTVIPPKKAEQSCLGAKQKSKFSGDFPSYSMCCVVICTAKK